MRFSFFSGRQHNDNDDKAEGYIRDQSCLYRHYCIPEVQNSVQQFTGVVLSDDQAVDIVQKIRNERGMGPIADYNLPGYEEE